MEPPRLDSHFLVFQQGHHRADDYVGLGLKDALAQLCIEDSEHLHTITYVPIYWKPTWHIATHLPEGYRPPLGSVALPIVDGLLGEPVENYDSGD